MQIYNVTEATENPKMHNVVSLVYPMKIFWTGGFDLSRCVGEGSQDPNVDTQDRTKKWTESKPY